MAVDRGTGASAVDRYRHRYENSSAPSLKPVAGTLLDIGQSVIFGLLEFVASIIIAGFLFSPAPQLVDALGALLRRILSNRGAEMVHHC